MNVQSLLSNRDHLVHDIVCYSPAVILLSEARVTEDVEDFELDINGYRTVRCNSASRRTGGVVVYIRDDISFKVFKSFSVDKTYWCIFVSLKLHFQDFLVGCLYRSPSSGVRDFFNCFESWAEDVFSSVHKCILVGDFNLDYLKIDNVDVVYFKQYIATIGVEQLVTEPTRVTNTSETLIDYVLTNVLYVTHIVHDLPKIADHSNISVAVRSLPRPLCNNRKLLRNFCSDSLCEINRRLVECEWSLDLADVDLQYTMLVNNTVSCIDSVTPLKSIVFRDNHLPWYDREVITLTGRRDEAYRNFRRSREYDRLQYWLIYKQCRNEVVNLLKRKKTNYYRCKIDAHANNSREMWKTLKALVKPQNASLPDIVVFNNREVQSDEMKAEMFNSYFIDSILEIRASIHVSADWSPVDYPLITCRMTSFSRLSLIQLGKLVSGLDNRCNSSALNNRVLKSIFEVIGHILLDLVNTSLETGQFPKELKVSTIVPIPKVPNSNEAGNFRPINTLPCVEKLLELAVYHQITEYVDRNNLLMVRQSGFRSQHSCETALQLTISEWKLLVDDGKYIVAVFLDFKRAFETVDVRILLEKLAYYGFSGTVLLWFQNYLTNRFQNTKVNNFISSSKLVKTGVPQGSVLGPLMFILYLNDINYLKHSEFINLFADDTLLAVSDVCLSRAVEKMNGVLEELTVFLNVNKLKLNVGKSKAMIVTTPYRSSLIDPAAIDLRIYDEPLEIVSEFKYLGFVVDNTLSLREHFKYIHGKISKKLFFFSRISSHLSAETSLVVFRTIIQPHFDYCASLLFLFNSGYVSSLQRLSNRGMRVILRCSRYTPIGLMLEALCWVSVRDRLYCLAMTFIFKILHGFTPTYFDRFIVLHNQVHSYNTRGSSDLFVPRTKYRSTMNSLFHRGLIEYNKLPALIKQSSSVRCFKHNLLNYIR